jgi:regulator of protease activity HflC (stomatin/prohibitin superfamily)
MLVISRSNPGGAVQDPQASPPHAAQKEDAAAVLPGLALALILIASYGLATGLEFAGAGAAVFGIVLYVVGGIGFGGLLVVQPNEALVLILFGRYVGTVTEPGFWWCNPFAKRRSVTVSLRVRNFQTERIKVNDAAGNPIEIAAVVVWRIADTAKAVFDVDDYERFVVVQSETGLRELAGRYSYDDDGQGSPSLRGTPDQINRSLQVELQGRLDIAGIEVIETGLTHLAYAPEIAALMLRRQQAEAVIAARKTMVRGVAGLVRTAVGQLAESDLIELDPERKAAMVSSLMVVLAGDRTPTAVINTGSLYT